MRLVSDTGVLELPLDIGLPGEELLKGGDLAPGAEELSTQGLDRNVERVDPDIVLAALSLDLDVQLANLDILGKASALVSRVDLVDLLLHQSGKFIKLPLVLVLASVVLPVMPLLLSLDGGGMLGAEALNGAAILLVLALLLFTEGAELTLVLVLLFAALLVVASGLVAHVFLEAADFLLVSVVLLLHLFAQPLYLLVVLVVQPAHFIEVVSFALRLEPLLLSKLAVVVGIPLGQCRGMLFLLRAQPVHGRVFL